MIVASVRRFFNSYRRLKVITVVSVSKLIQIGYLWVSPVAADDMRLSTNSDLAFASNSKTGSGIIFASN